MIIFVAALLLILFWVIYFMMPPPPALPILAYQRITQDKNDRLSLSVARLNEHLVCLKRLGYQPISFSDLRDHVRDRQPMPEKPILLTFDDGYESIYKLAYPLLKRNNFRATILLPTKCIEEFNDWNRGSERIIGHETLRQMTRDIVEVGIQLPQQMISASYSAVEFDDHLSQSIQTLEREQYSSVRVFAYQGGAMPRDRIKRESDKQVLKKHGIEFALHVGSRINTLPPRDLYEMKRIEIRGSDSLRQFKRKLKKGRSRALWLN